MNATYDPTSIANASTALRERLEHVRDTVEHFSEVAKQDARPKVQRLETMVHALERDVWEVTQPSGASEKTTRKLAKRTDLELTDLENEMDALDAGNPTTVEAALEAILRGVEKVEKALKKLRGETHGT